MGSPLKRFGRLARLCFPTGGRRAKKQNRTFWARRPNRLVVEVGGLLRHSNRKVQVWLRRTYSCEALPRSYCRRAKQDGRVYFAIQTVKLGYGYVGPIPAKPYLGHTADGRSRMVGKVGFEPTTSWSRTKRASRAALLPDYLRVLY